MVGITLRSVFIRRVCRRTAEEDGYFDSQYQKWKKSGVFCKTSGGHCFCSTVVFDTAWHCFFLLFSVLWNGGIFGTDTVGVSLDPRFDHGRTGGLAASGHRYFGNRSHQYFLCRAVRMAWQ